MPKTKPACKTEAQFHAVVRKLVRDTLDLAESDNKFYELVCEYVHDGLYEHIGEHIGIEQVLMPNFDSYDVLAAADEKNGLRQLVKQAAMAESLEELTERWDEVVATADLLPSLTWPVIKVKKPKNKGKKKE